VGVTGVGAAQSVDGKGYDVTFSGEVGRSAQKDVDNVVDETVFEGRLVGVEFKSRGDGGSKR